MRSSLKSQFKYINWNLEAEKRYLTIKQFEDKLDKFKRTRTISKSNTIRKDFYEEDTYTYSENGNWRSIYCKEKNKYVIYCINKYDDEVNKQCFLGNYNNPGIKSKTIVSKLFKEKFGITEKTAFGYCDREELNICIPKSFFYINKQFNDMNLEHVSKADVSSNYPSHLCGKLPTWKNHKVLAGTVKPTAEYPFAFYVNSGHSAEFQVYDTHTWMNYEIGAYLFKMDKFKPIPEEQDKTILCKASDFEFTDIIKDLYKAKENKEIIDGLEAKLILNSFIGTMHRTNIENPRYRLDHVAAVCLARANNDMLKTYLNLRKYKINVLQIIVDGIIYQSPKEIGTDIKELGNLVQEVTDCDYRQRGANAYIFMKDNEVLEFKHGGYNSNLEITKLEDINNWTRKEEF